MISLSFRYHILPVIFLIVATSFAFPGTADAGIIEGTVYDSTTAQPVPRVTIRVEGAGMAMLGNDDGRYRLRLDPGTYTLRFSHVAHYSTTIDVTIGDSTVVRDISMNPSIIQLPGSRVYSRQYDPGQEVIIEAIRRKKDLLSKIRDYQFDGYTKFVVRKVKEDTTDEFMLITETQLEGWYRQPDHYKEIITARRQSSNLDAEGNLVTVGQIFNFNANRIDLGRQKIVSPTATDALDFYNYYLLDTVLLDGYPAFRLEIEPKSDAHPLFVGEILIVDSSYAVAGVEVGLNAGFEAPFIRNLRYSQRLARFENDIWMPVEIRISADLRLPIPGVPEMTAAYTAMLNRLLINEGVPPERFDEYAIEVAPMADNVDSATWDLGALVPLTDEELAGYQYIDSLENRPFSLKRAAVYIPLGIILVGQSPQAYPFAHFNRVEGPYLGAGLTLPALIPRSELHVRSGWAFDGEYWQHRYRLRTDLHQATKLFSVIEYHDEMISRPLVFTDERLNPTLMSLAYKLNPLDYYLEKGFELGLGFRPLRHTRFEVAYRDYNQYSVANATDYDLFDLDKAHRPNPAIANGHLRSVSAIFTVDSRDLIRNKNREDTLTSIPFTVITAGIEHADPDLIDNDFRFRRYYLQVDRLQHLPGWGTTSIRFFAGGSDRALPPQRYFTLDHGDPDNILFTQFKTFGETNFTGDRTALFYLGQDFGTTVFRKSHLPLVERIPLSLLAYGGMVWSDFGAASLKVPGEPLHAAPDWYSEIGVGLGRIPPVLFRLYFTWQLSAYDTNRFSVKCSLGF